MTSPMPGPFDHENGSEPDLDALAALADGRLAAESRASLLAHLSGCAQCRSVLAALVQDKRASSSWWRTRALPLAASILVVAAASGLYVLRREATPVRFEPQAPAAAPAATAPTVSPPAGSATPAPTDAAPAPVDTAPAPDRTRSAGTRSVGGKTFRLVAGEWIDTAYRSADFLPAVSVDSADALESAPALKRFATALGPRFTVVIDGTVYRVAIRR